MITKLKSAFTFLWLMLSACAFVGCSAQRVETLRPDQTQGERVMSSTVKIELFGGGHGSGFAVGPHTILTARHVVDNAATLFMGTVTTHDGSTCELVAMAISPDVDAAALQVRGCRLRPLQIASKAPRRGDMAGAAGHPYDWGAVWTTGVVANPAPNASGDIALSLSALPGMSGGPIVNANDEVIGILVSGELAEGLIHRRVWGGLTFMVSIQDVPGGWL
jgi:S1-C subfamily serine protease